MINVVLPVIDNPEEYSKSIAAVAGRNNVALLIGVTEELEKQIAYPNSAVVKVYKNGSLKEEIINSLKAYLPQGKVIIARRPFSKKEFDNILASQGQIVFFEKKPKNKFTAFFKRLAGKLIQAMFGVRLFDGDISLIAFDESMSEVLANVNSLSYSTRVDRWRGVEQTTAMAEREQVKIENSKASFVKMLIGAILSFAIPVLITILVSVLCKVPFLIGMLLFCIDAVGLAGMFLILCMLYFNTHAGQRYFGEAVQVYRD